MNELLHVSTVLGPIWDSISFDLIVEDEAFQKILTSPIFIHPKLKQIKKGENESLILISAPGAVGKTTFAKYATFVKKGYYIDLAKIKLGDNTFLGSLAKYFGTKKISEVLSYFEKGDITFFIDAFDEAEIISGWEGVENFVREIFTHCGNSPKPQHYIFFTF